MPLPALVDWNHEKSLLLISKFKTHEALWNSNNKSFHNAKKKEDAWWALAKEIDVPAAEAKRKIEGLRGSYRRERSKVRASKEKAEKYCPKWFAYKSLAFLEETRPQDVLDSEHVGGDLGVASTPSVIPHPSKLDELHSSEKKSGYLDNREYISPHDELELSSKQRRFCRSDSYKPRPNPEFKKEKAGLEIKPAVEGTICDPLGTLTEPQPKDGTGSPDKLGEEMLPHDKFELSPKKRRFCSTSGPYKPVRRKPDSRKGKPGLDIEPRMEGTISDTSTILDPPGTLTEPPTGSRLLDGIEEEMLPHDKFELSPNKRRFCSTSGPYKPVRRKPDSRKGKPGLDIEPRMEGTISDTSTILDPPGTLTEPPTGSRLLDGIEEEMLPHDKFELSPNKRRFCSTSGPYKPVRRKPDSRKGKPGLDIEPRMEGTISDTSTILDPPGTLTEPSSGSRLLDRIEEETLQPWIGELQENVGFSIGYFRNNSTNKSENTTPKRAIPNEEVMGWKFSRGVNRPEVFKRNNKPLQRQEDDKSDECTAFGQLVESTLRQLPVLQRIKAKMKLSQVLWEVELEALNHNPPPESMLACQKRHPRLGSQS